MIEDATDPLPKDRTRPVNVAVSRSPSGARVGVDRAVSAALPTPVAAHGGAPLRLRGVSKAFGGVHAIEAVDLDVAPGEIRAIIGPNGAGKSTLLNLISGLYRADEGTIAVGSQTKGVIRASRLARLGVSRTFQNLALFDGLSVAQNVAMGHRATVASTTLEQIVGLGRVRRERAATRERVDDILTFLDLADIRDRGIDGLPYGIRKRIELARAIVARPRLLLLDEPLAGMNGADKPAMARFIRATRETLGTTIVLIEHDIGFVLDLADRIAVLDHGRKIADGTPEEVRRDPSVIAAYLGVEPGEAAAA